MDIYCNSRGSAWNLQKSAVISSELDLTYTNHLRFMGYYFKSLEIAATFLCYYIELQTPPQHFEFIDARPVRSQSTWNSSDWQHLSPNLVDNLERWYSDYRFVSRCTCLFLFSAFVFIISRLLNTYLIASRQFCWISVCWFFIIAHIRLFIGNEHLRHRNVRPFVITGKSRADI